MRILQLTGRCREGEGDRGHLFHAVPEESNKAICGAKPGRHAEWWPFRDENAAVTCKRCLKKLPQVTAKCIGCGASKDFGAYEVPAGDYPCCDKCGMPMIAVKSRVTPSTTTKTETDMSKDQWIRAWMEAHEKLIDELMEAQPELTYQQAYDMTNELAIAMVERQS